MARPLIGLVPLTGAERSARKRKNYTWARREIERRKACARERIRHGRGRSGDWKLLGRCPPPGFEDRPAPRKSWYERYLLSDDWAEKRALAIQAADGRCRLCNRSERLVVHHRTYVRLGDESLSDLTVLCWDCHDLFHRHREIGEAMRR